MALGACVFFMVFVLLAVWCGEPTTNSATREARN
jgi:hypothetical protein